MNEPITDGPNSHISREIPDGLFPTVPAIVPDPAEPSSTDVPSCIPPKTVKRNEHGLLESGVKYVYNSEGQVDWRKMLDSKHLAVNKANFEKRKQPIPPTVDGLEDKDLLLLLSGIKFLAHIRGFYDVEYSVTSPSNEYIVAACKIRWIPNFETEGREVSFSAIGDASPFNTNSFGKNYLGPIAENRAFVRAVRNFLRINIVSQEELAPTGHQESKPLEKTYELLQNAMTEAGVTLETIKNSLIKEKFDGAEDIKVITDIPKFKCLEMTERCKKKIAK